MIEITFSGGIRMWKRIRERAVTIRFTLLLIVLLCWLLPTALLGGYMGSRVFASLQDKTEAALVTGAMQAQTLVLGNIDHVVSLAKAVVYDDEIRAAYQDYAGGRQSYETYYRLARGYLDRKFSREPFCARAFFIPADDPQNLIYTSRDYSDSVRFLQSDLAAALKACETIDTRCHLFSGESGCYLIKNLYDTRLSRYGALALGMNMDTIMAPAFDAAARWNSALALSLDDYKKGTFLSGQNETGLREYGSALCCTLKADAYDYAFRIEVQADKNAVYHEMFSFRRMMLWLMALLIPVCFLIMTFVRRRIVKPIALLSRASERIQNGEWGITVPMHGADELGKLGSAFSTMSLRLKEMIDRSYKEEIALRDARIQSMQSRINPHFLNNALEAINWQARIDKAENVAEMVETLSVLLNAALGRSERHLVPLREELFIADAYFYFARQRFGNKLKISRVVAPEADQAPIPRLTIQTLIENAVEHGIAPMGGGFIGLSALISDGFLVIAVVNSGAKLPECELARINGLLDDAAPSDGHLGVRNVQQRARLLFGPAAKLAFSQDAQGRTVATLKIPLPSKAQAQAIKDNHRQDVTAAPLV